MSQAARGYGHPSQTRLIGQKLADDHQRRNAEALVEAGAAVLIPEVELTAERLVKTVGELLADRKRLAEMSAAGRKLAHPDAAQVIAGMAATLAETEKG